MTKNLETADALVRLLLSISVIVLYFTKIIGGPFAATLSILSALSLLILIAKWAFRRRTNKK